jgi:hypothetical protein
VPYAASKACADLVALSYWQTYGVPVCVTRSSNNYGPGQHPEKMIPCSVTSLLKGGKITLHGRGEHVRNWLHVEDNCAAIELVLRDGTPGGVYNIAGTTELANRDLAALLLDACGATPDQVEYIPDRRANDLRYSMTCDRVTTLGWQPERPFAEGLAQTVEWYRDNPGRWVDLATLCVTAGDILEAVTPATRAVMPVLYGGRAVDLTGIAAELANRGILVIEDAAHAFGSFSGERRVGATGTLTCFSFDPIKNLTCGEGSALVPRGPAEAQRARTIRDLGITQSRDQRSCAPPAGDRSHHARPRTARYRRRPRPAALRRASGGRLRGRSDRSPTRKNRPATARRTDQGLL